FLTLRRHPSSTLFPYTTLFRSFILNPMANAIELLCTICEEFSVPYDASTLSVKTLTDKLQQFLLKNYADGRKSILLIDEAQLLRDRKSTRLNSSHVKISYAVFC